MLANSKSHLSDGFTRWRLEQHWSQIVGETIAEQTAPAHFDKGVLQVWVRHPAWMQQLWYFKEPIKEKVNAYLGQAWVQEVKFTTNRRSSTGPEGSSPIGGSSPTSK